ncbi:MAG: hypothetical protein J6C40_05905 [Lentisphaeria bacterium]|nr:hypothetical protein [Lentisphaeria bacterium]
MKKRCVALLFFCVLSVTADVFTLWPVRRSKNGKGDAAAILNGTFKQLLHKEKITVNGIALEMEITQADIPFDALLARLKNSLGRQDFTAHGSTVRIGYPLSRDRVERWLLVRNGKDKTTVFYMISPAKLPPPEGWPQELPPLPAGAEVAQTLKFPRRGGVLGTFRNAAGDRRMLLRQMTRHLEGDGWIAAGAEASVSDSGGDLFIRTRNGREIIWVAAGDDGSGSCYYRKSK